MHPGVVGDELVEFADGSRVWLDVRDGSAELRRLAALSTCWDLYLRRVEPCFGCCWYQLAFASVQQPGPTIFARVMRYESETALLSWDPGFRWQLRRRERHDGRVPSGAPRWPSPVEGATMAETCRYVGAPPAGVAQARETGAVPAG